MPVLRAVSCIDVIRFKIGSGLFGDGRMGSASLAQAFIAFLPCDLRRDHAFRCGRYATSDGICTAAVAAGISPAWAGAGAGAGPLGSRGVNRGSDFSTRAGDKPHREFLARSQR